MKLIGADGVIARARRYLSAATSVDSSDVEDKDRLARMLRSMSVRIADLEARVGPEAIDFETILAVGGTTTLTHGFSSPVRWWVVEWTRPSGGSYPAGNPILYMDESSTNNALVLKSNVAGRAIVRVEPAASGIKL